MSIEEDHYPQNAIHTAHFSFTVDEQGNRENKNNQGACFTITLQESEGNVNVRLETTKLWSQYAQELFEGAASVFPREFNPDEELNKIKLLKASQEQILCDLENNSKDLAEKLNEELQSRFAMIGGYTNGKYVEAINSHRMHFIDQSTGQLCMHICTKYPDFATSSYTYSHEDPSRPFWKIHIIPTKPGDPYFTIRYFFDDTKGWSAKLYREQKLILNEELPENLERYAATLLQASTGSWLSICQLFRTSIALIDPNNDQNTIPLTPNAADVYAADVAQKLMKIRELNASKLPTETYTQVRKAITWLTVPYKDSSLTVKTVYSGSVPEDQSPEAFEKFKEFIESLPAENT